MKKKRLIPDINEDLCTGCEECISICMADALKMVGGKVKLLSELFCDGMGKCVKACPEGAIALKAKEVDEYEEKSVMANIVKQGTSMIVAHLDHLRSIMQWNINGKLWNT